MARQIWAFWLVLSWSGFCHTDHFRGNGHKLRIFLFLKAGKFKTNMARVPYNNNLLLTEREGHTAEYWPEVVAVRTERSEVHTKTTEGQYSPVRLELARLVSSLLYGTRAMLVCRLSKAKNTQLMTVSTGTVRMAKSRPRKDQSERSDLPCHNNVVYFSPSLISWFFSYREIRKNKNVLNQIRIKGLKFSDSPNR